MKSNGIIGNSWEELAKHLNKELGYNYGESKYRKEYQNAQKYYENVFSDMTQSSELIAVKAKTRELELLKTQVQTEKLELNRWKREIGRDDLIFEKIGLAMKDLEPLIIPDLLLVTHNREAGCLFFGDEHYGVEFEIKGLSGEIINSYNPEIFEDRMYKLLSYTIGLIDEHNLSELHIFSLGDFIDGLLRVGQLFILRYGVIDSSVRYGYFLANWLNELSQYARIKFHMTDGNHSELRMLGQPKGTFTHENLGIVVRAMLKILLENNPNIEVIENPTGLIYENICGFNVLAFHGDKKNIKDAYGKFQNFYGVKLDYLVAGHIHHLESSDVGRHAEVINVPSVMGVDPFAEKILQSSDSAAYFTIFEEGKGRTASEKIYLS